MNDEQKMVAELAAQILSGILAGTLAKVNSDMGAIRQHHVQGAVNLALGLIEEVKKAKPA